MSDPDDLPCTELVEQVTDYLEDALDAADRARFERHLQECEGCVEHVDQISRTIALLHAVPQDEGLSATARSRLLTAFREWRQDHSSGA